jgi:hypothetical protein
MDSCGRRPSSRGADDPSPDGRATWNWTRVVSKVLHRTACAASPVRGRHESGSAVGTERDRRLLNRIAPEHAAPHIGHSPRSRDVLPGAQTDSLDAEYFAP